MSVASRLAEAHGFEGVGLREVAERAGLAIGTVYKSFQSKEDMLAAVVAKGIESMRAGLGTTPSTGEPVDRVIAFFRALTRVVTRHPPIGRELIAALSSHSPALVSPIRLSDAETKRMIVAAIRGVPVSEVDEPTQDESEQALILRHLWFASMVGWANEMHPLDDVIRHVEIGARRVL